MRIFLPHALWHWQFLTTSLNFSGMQVKVLTAAFLVGFFLLGEEEQEDNEELDLELEEEEEEEEELDV